ncbi:hypothetical protein SFRURICE_004558, partial [Spodoptera frugiperda]
MTNTCPNTLPYLYDGHSWTEYASYFHHYLQICFGEEFRYTANSVCINKRLHRTIELLCGNGRMSRFPHVILAGRLNRPCIEILLQIIFEDNDEIRRIFSPRVTVIEIRKRVRA